MLKIRTTSRLQRILQVNLLLISISAFIVISIGISLKSLKRDVNSLNAYLVAASDVQPNFEKSLSLYTDTTKDALVFVDSIRPGSEAEYVQFISMIEDIAQEMSIPINIDTIGTQAIASSSERSPSIKYSVSFFGSRKDLATFLRKLETLPYYVRVDSLDFKSLDFIAQEKTKSLPNVSLILRLYVK